jgi:hypothetical protein
MSSSHNGPQKLVTSQELDAWLLAAQAQRAALHLAAAGPSESDQRQEAFAAMSALLQEAFEHVRVVSDALRAERHTDRGKTIALHEHYAQRLEHSTAAMERLAQLLPYMSAERRQAESQTLNLWKDERLCAPAEPWRASFLKRT